VESIVILISGRGSNMEAIVDACQKEGWPARVVAVISNRPDAAGLALAQSFGIATRVIDHTAYTARAAFDHELARTIDATGAHWVVLAGFMRILSEDFVKHFEGRIINIHPSLLPAFPGLATHRRAIEAGVAVHGATVHFVTSELDHGPIVGQGIVNVLQSDSEQSLAARVQAIEHRLYPEALARLVSGMVHLESGRVVAKDGKRLLLQGE
jgi:phosphoribosylglycinamide formyltransferase 1